MDIAQIRSMHRGFEVYHGMIYFVPEAAAAYAELGITGRMGYFASRASAMGAVGPETVISTFFNFNPDLVYAAIPEAGIEPAPSGSWPRGSVPRTPRFAGRWAMP